MVANHIHYYGTAVRTLAQLIMISTALDDTDFGIELDFFPRGKPENTEKTLTVRLRPINLSL